ncbi:MAG: response regulator [Candidatus Omnitrophica bacterium]|nr:response regulator [Candidatus Omnitrophota bacterium]
MLKRKMKLLVVDDEKDICHFVKLLFKKEGFLVYSALSGTQALNAARKIKPDITLLDIYLKKGITGLEVLEQIRKSVPNCRNIMVTWDKAEEKMQEAKKLGAVSYLTKPLTVTQLLKVVTRIAKQAEREGR